MSPGLNIRRNARDWRVKWTARTMPDPIVMEVTDITLMIAWNRASEQALTGFVGRVESLTVARARG